MREKMASPDLNTILDEHHGVAEIHTRTSVREAARIMKQCHTTASLIMEEGRIAGIFTTKVCYITALWIHKGLFFIFDLQSKLTFSSTFAPILFNRILSSGLWLQDWSLKGPQ
jgi:hypothetical protein